MGEKSAVGDDLAGQIAALRADLERLTEGLGDVAQGKAADLMAALQGRLDSTETLVKDKMAGAEATLDEMADYARRKPLQALAIAAGTGMLLGLLFGRR